MRESIYVVGEVKGKPRARLSRRNRHDAPVMYHPTTAKGWEYPVGIALTDLATKIGHPISTPVRINITFYFERPKSHWRKTAMYKILLPSAPIYHDTRPDRDNCDKIILDQAQAVGLITNDCHVVMGSIEKRWATHEPPGAMIEIDDEFPNELRDLYEDPAFFDLTQHPRTVPLSSVRAKR